MFAYSADGFHMGFDPYPVQVASDTTNAQTISLTTTSRSRSITFKSPCDRLPPAEQAGCVGSAQTTLNNATDGKWMPSWSAPYQVNGVNTPKPIVNLNSVGWVYTNATAGRPFGYPTLTVAGYWFALNPDTINNCNNCFPSAPPATLTVRMRPICCQSTSTLQPALRLWMRTPTRSIKKMRMA